MAATTTAPKQPSRLHVNASERGALIRNLPPKLMLASLKTPPAAAIHSMARARNMAKYTQVDSSLSRCRASKRAMANMAAPSVALRGDAVAPGNGGEIQVFQVADGFLEAVARVVVAVDVDQGAA